MYDPTTTEARWQAAWQAAKLHHPNLKEAKKPFMSMVMFPYPSGDKLHVGHWYNFAPADSFARYQRMRGYDVFEPMGFDAFGLPAENYAIKTGVPPAQSIAKNVETMIEQLSKMGCMYDWDRMVNTSTPEYYRWTQWLFLQMHKAHVAYKKDGNVNWCPKCQTVLANEQCQDGTCERCGTGVTQRQLAQWYWKTTAYAQQLLDGLDGLDWPEKTKLMQRNWIDRSEGVNFSMRVRDLDISFAVYDSIPQTYRAQTFVVIAPEHPLVAELVRGTVREQEVLAFVEQSRQKKAAKQFKFEEDMAGIDTGRVVVDPFGTGDLPIWVANFVVMDYGTGIVSCSAHDERDFAFAKHYGIPLRPVMFPADPVAAQQVRDLVVCYTKDPEGILQEPAAFAGRKWGEVRADIIAYIEAQSLGKRQVNYRLKDWLVSRQRYWGAPIPIVYDPEGNPHRIPEEHLPWLLPTDVEFRPNGESPLRLSAEFKERTERIFGKGWTPEYDTMDTFVCSSFYYLRYLAEGDTSRLVDPEVAKQWLPVSMYIGGPEHACMHLIYARFVMMALKDAGIVEHGEPFRRLVHQGLITNQGAKMSKSKGNVVSPDSFVERHGADVFRMYLMFMGPYTDGGDWSDSGIKGIDRFVQRVWRLMGAEVALTDAADSKDVTFALHRAVKQVTESLEGLRFNTAISALMELLNALEAQPTISRNVAHIFTLLLAPLAPHLADELWHLHGGEGFVVQQVWPTYDEAFLVLDTITLAVQVNGKVRGEVQLSPSASEADALAAAQANDNVAKHLADKTLRKVVYVPGKLLSLVV